jgi:excinuclease ABC subunit B
MEEAIRETNRRREKQDAYNKEHGIVPTTIIKSVRSLIEISSDVLRPEDAHGVKMTKREREEAIAKLEKEMRKASKMLEYEYAAVLRDRIIELRTESGKGA